MVRDRAAAERLHDDPSVDTLSQQQGRAPVAQIVEAHPR
jgi:hypothetical protein